MAAGCASALRLSSQGSPDLSRSAYWTKLGAGASVAAIGTEPHDHASGWLALFTFGDPIRADAHTVVRELLARGKAVSMLSGDRPAAAREVAEQLGIAHVVAGATPQDKLDHVLRLQAAGEKVAMIGDGVNDAPVLAAATVSMTMAGSTDVARATADAVLMTDKLHNIVEAVDQATRTTRVIRQNFGWAIAYNLVALPLAALGHVTPWMAGLGMAASSLLVVANALRLTRAVTPASREFGVRRCRFSICLFRSASYSCW